MDPWSNQTKRKTVLIFSIKNQKFPSRKTRAANSTTHSSLGSAPRNLSWPRASKTWAGRSVCTVRGIPETRRARRSRRESARKSWSGVRIMRKKAIALTSAETELEVWNLSDCYFSRNSVDFRGVAKGASEAQCPGCRITVVFSLWHFAHFSLRHFSRWNISVIYLTVVWKLAVTVFISLCYYTFWPKLLNFCRSFQTHFGL